MPQPIIIFGATGGFGTAIARKLKSDGQRLILHGRNRNRLQELGDELDIPPSDLIDFDATDFDAVEEALRLVSDRYPKLAGAVVSVAKHFDYKLTHRQPWSAFADQIDVHLRALHGLAIGLRPMLIGQPGSARLVLISSEAVIGSPPMKLAPYVTAKAAMTAYAQVIAQEWLRDGVRVQIIAPGMSRTELMGDLPEMFLRQIEEGFPEKMLTKVEDVADLTAFCLTAAADTLYGQPIRVSRGPRQ